MHSRRRPVYATRLLLLAPILGHCLSRLALGAAPLRPRSLFSSSSLRRLASVSANSPLSLDLLPPRFLGPRNWLLASKSNRGSISLSNLSRFQTVAPHVTQRDNSKSKLISVPISRFEQYNHVWRRPRCNSVVLCILGLRSAAGAPPAPRPGGRGRPHRGQRGRPPGQTPSVAPMQKSSTYIMLITIILSVIIAYVERICCHV